MPAQKAETVQVPEELSQELVLLRGFRDLINEGLGYYFGAKAVQSEASDATKDQRTAANAIRKDISKNLESWIENADIEAYRGKVAELKTARKTLSEAMKPHNEKKRPLTRAWKYCVNVAFPDSLKELGSPVSPRFSLSKWIAAAIEKKD